MIDTDARVLNVDEHFGPMSPVIDSRTYVDLTARLRELRRVVHKIAEGLFQPCRVTQHVNGFRVEGDGQLLAALADMAIDDIDGTAQETGEFNGCQLQRQFAL